MVSHQTGTSAKTTKALQQQSWARERRGSWAPGDRRLWIDSSTVTLSYFTVSEALQSVPRPMLYFCSGFGCPILCTVHHALCFTSNLFKMLFHYYFYLSWKMEKSNNGGRPAGESLFNLHSGEFSQETVHWPWVRTERGEGRTPSTRHRATWSTSLHCGRKVFWKNCSAFGAITEGKDGAGGAKAGVLKMNHARLCNDRAF